MILFVLLIAAVPVAAYFVIRWYAYDNWTVTLQGDRVVITQGQPGGVLWFHPRLVEHTPYTTADIPLVSLAAVQAGVQEPSVAAARHYVDGLHARIRGHHDDDNDDLHHVRFGQVDQHHDDRPAPDHRGHGAMSAAAPGGGPNGVVGTRPIPRAVKVSTRAASVGSGRHATG